MFGGISLTDNVIFYRMFPSYFLCIKYLNFYYSFAGTDLKTKNKKKKLMSSNYEINAKTLLFTVFTVHTMAAFFALKPKFHNLPSSC